MTEAHPPHQAPRSGGNSYPNSYPPSGSGAPTEGGAVQQRGAQPYEPYPPSPQPYSSYPPSPQPYEPYPPSPQPYSSYRPDAPGPSLYQPAAAQAQQPAAAQAQQPAPGQQQPVPPGYQQPVPGAVPARPPRRRRRGLVVLVVALVVVLVAGGGTAAWWFVLRNRGATYEPSTAVPADEWADGARQMGSSTIMRDATIAVSPDGSFLAALSESSFSGTGRLGSREKDLKGYSLADGQTSESWHLTLTDTSSTTIRFWGDDTIVLGSTLYDVATGNHHDAPWDSGEASIVNGLALSCEDGSCTAWKKDGSKAWSVDVDKDAQTPENAIVRGGKHYVITGTTVINIDDGDSFTLDVPDAPRAHGMVAQDGWAVQTYDDDFQDGHLYTFKPDGKRVGDTAIESGLDRSTYILLPPKTLLSLSEISAWLSGEDKDGPKDKRVGEYTANSKKCTISITMDNGASFDSPEIHEYRDGKVDSDCELPQTSPSNGSRVVWFYDAEDGGPFWHVYALVNAKTGKSIDFPGLDPTRGDHLIFANPSTAVGYSPKDGTLTTYKPA